jgi:subtilisin-like proprotein convertase family protein
MNIVALRSLVVALTAFLSVGLLPQEAFAQFSAATAASGSKSVPAANMDIRVNGQGPTAALARSAAVSQRAQTQTAGIARGVARLRAKVPSLEARVSSETGAIEVLRSATSLTGPAPGRSGVDIVRGFISENSAIYGLAANDIANLRFIGESLNRVSGLRMVRVEQMINGLPVFQSDTRFILDREGRVIRSTGLMIPGATAVAPQVVQRITAPEALRDAMSSVGIDVDIAQMKSMADKADKNKLEITAKNEHIAGNVPSKLVYFPLAPGTLALAWSQTTFTNTDSDWYTIVDATTGEVLWRKNIRDYASTHEARFQVYVQADGKTPADSPAPQSPSTAAPGSGTQFPEIARTIVNMLTVQDIVASPNGWIDDCPGGGCTTNETQTIGNNVHAYMDAQGGANANAPDTNVSFMLDGNGKPIGNPDASARNRDFAGVAPRDFTLTPPPQGGNPEAGQTATGAGSSGTLPIDAYRRGAVTQLFYVCNWYHDQLYKLGFDEAAGNFQQTNFSGMGVGGDRVLAEAQDSSGTDNANFSTPADGSSGRAQMYRFVGPTIDRDGDLDAEILIHELTHGTSNRLIGNATGLLWDPGRGMGEGWSDFYALSLLNNTNADNPNARYGEGSWATYKFAFPTVSPAYVDNYVYGIRRFPYCTDNSVNPMTWADVDDTTNNLSGGIPPTPITLFNAAGGGEVHNIGEIWALTLWEVRSRVIGDPAGANGDVPTGNTKMLSIVTDALKMTPVFPSFIEARDALFDADCAANTCANEESIWGGFADRGLGYNAVAPLKKSGVSRLGTVGHTGIGESFDVPYLDVQSVTIDDSAGNNNGAIDPGEAIKITVALKNPWRRASKGVASATATLSSSTAGVSIYDHNSTYPAIAAQGSASGDSFTFFAPTSATCGQSLKFTITSTSSLGTKAVNFVLRVGLGAGNGAPVIYTRTIPGGLAIPDATLLGVTDTFTIPDDNEIADLNFRVDSLTHTFTGDLAVMLKAPNGYGTDFIHYRGAFIGTGDGDNFVNTVIDDQQPNDAAHDLNQSATAQAPFTGSWLPAFNSPVWPLLVTGLASDTVGQLGRLNGLSTQGDWKVHVVDRLATDTGTLNSWSLIVTPKAFTCAAVSVQALGAVSRKTHGGAGVQDIGMPPTGPAGIECRSGGATKDYELQISFAHPVSVGGGPQARVTTGIGDVGTGGVADVNGTVSIAGGVVSVPLTNIGNAQTIVVTLFGVNDGASPVGNVSVPMSILVGDTSNNGAVSSTDVTQTKSQSGQAVGVGNFREDVVVTGSINGTDVSAVKARSGTALP